MSPTTNRRPRRRLLPAVALGLAVLCLVLAGRFAAVRADGDRGEQTTVSIVVWTVAALALALIATGILSGWASEQLAIFGG